MEFLEEHDRYEQGVLSRDIKLPIAVAAMQRLIELEEDDE